MQESDVETSTSAGLVKLASVLSTSVPAFPRLLHEEALGRLPESGLSCKT